MWKLLPLYTILYNVVFLLELQRTKLSSRHVNLAGSMSTLLQLLLRHQSGFPGRISDHHASFLHALYVALKVAADAIPHGHEGKFVFVEFVPVLSGELDHALGEAVVVFLLLHGVVEGGVAQVFFAVGDEEFFELECYDRIWTIAGWKELA